MITNPLYSQNAALPDGRSDHSVSLANRALVLGVVLAECAVLIALGYRGPVAGIFALGGLVLVVLSLARPTGAWLAVAALVPFSVETRIPGTGSALQAPTEPMILVLEAVWAFRVLQGYRISLPSRRLSWAVAGILVVAVLSCLYSDHRVASLRSSANLLWYVIFGFFLASASLRNEQDLRRFAMILSVPAALVSIYYLQNVARTGLSVETSNLGALPFFAEHGSFAAYLSFAFPMAVLALIWAPRRITKVFFAGVGFLVFAGILFSLTRAAWLGVLGMIATFVFYSTRSRRGRQVVVTLLVLALIGGGITAFRSTSLLSQHAQSMVNVKTNISNLERVNRWAAAVDMFRAHPIGGVGFGAYKYHYYEFRRIRLATTESAPRAGAHSLYLGVLSATGLVGALAATLFAIALFSTVGRTLAQCRGLGQRGQPLAQMTIALTAGLISYGIHGFFNNFLAWDKVAVPFWAFVGALVVCARLAVSMKPITGNAQDAS